MKRSQQHHVIVVIIIIIIFFDWDFGGEKIVFTIQRAIIKA
jgi:5S rRNA maturation endonuclease (ribonuclease M5)